MNPKFTVQLRQHTPIIHFQHDQPGATLRATEVKAKLDKFLWSDLEKYSNDLWEENKIIIKKVFKKRENGYSGNYKLHISAQLDQKYVLAATGGDKIKEKFEGVKRINNSPSKFQNENFDDIRLGLTYRSISMKFVCFHEGFEDFIRAVLPIFFANNNFGTRQTKGFGGFSLVDTRIEDFRAVLIANPMNLCVYEKRLRNSTPKEVLQTIQRDYKLLKAGDNNQRRGIYEKSLLWKFICNDDWNEGWGRPILNWEKRKIKQSLKNSTDQNLKDVWNELAYEYDSNFSDDHNSRNNLDAFYIRVLLGLAEHFEFKTKNRNDSIKTKNRNDSIKIKVSDASNTKDDIVERLASPILFKVFKNHLFLIGKPLNAVLFSKKNDQPRIFKFELNAEIRNQKIKKHLFDLTVPPNFDIEDFLEFALNDDSPINGYQNIN